MSIWRNTTYSERQLASPNEKYGAGSSSVTRNLILQNGSFTGRLQAAQDILGYSCLLKNTAITYTSTTYIHRVTPMPYAYAVDPPADVKPPPEDGEMSGGGFGNAPMQEFFYAVAISRTAPKGTGEANALKAYPVQAADYPKAEITVEYSILPYRVVDDRLFTYRNGAVPDEGVALASGWINSRYITRSIQPFSRLIKIPYGMMWNTGGPFLWRQADGSNYPTLPKQTRTGFPIREGGANVSYTWVQVPLTPSPGGVNWNYISTALGSINDANFDFAARDTLLLDNIQSREYQGAFGERYADITFNMIYLPHHSTGLNESPNGSRQGHAKGCPVGWNYIFDIVKGVPDYYFVSAEPGNPYKAPFQESDFTLLFRPPQTPTVSPPIC